MSGEVAERTAEWERVVEEMEGVSPCFTASAAVAGLIRLARQGDIPSSHTVLINLTGGDRPPHPPSGNVHWLRRSGNGWALEDSSDARGRERWQPDS